MLRKLGHAHGDRTRAHPCCPTYYQWLTMRTKRIPSLPAGVPFSIAVPTTATEQIGKGPLKTALARTRTHTASAKRREKKLEEVRGYGREARKAAASLLSPSLPCPLRRLLLFSLLVRAHKGGGGRRAPKKDEQDWGAKPQAMQWTRTTMTLLFGRRGARFPPAAVGKQKSAAAVALEARLKGQAIPFPAPYTVQQRNPSPSMFLRDLGKGKGSTKERHCEWCKEGSCAAVPSPFHISRFSVGNNDFDARHEPRARCYPSVPLKRGLVLIFMRSYGSLNRLRS